MTQRSFAARMWCAEAECARAVNSGSQVGAAPLLRARNTISSTRHCIRHGVVGADEGEAPDAADAGHRRHHQRVRSREDGLRAASHFVAALLEPTAAVLPSSCSDDAWSITGEYATQACKLLVALGELEKSQAPFELVDAAVRVRVLCTICARIQLWCRLPLTTFVTPACCCAAAVVVQGGAPHGVAAVAPRLHVQGH